MLYKTFYETPISKATLLANDNSLLGLWLEGQKHYFAFPKDIDIKEGNTEILEQTKLWLDDYFNKKHPNIKTLNLSPQGSSFAQKVWQTLKDIPYGKTITYGDIAKKIALAQGNHKMSAQAVGQAVGHNPISIIIPCHRVVGANNNLTGYAGGIEKKIYLLQHEEIDIKNFSIPKNKKHS